MSLSSSQSTHSHFSFLVMPHNVTLTFRNQAIAICYFFSLSYFLTRLSLPGTTSAYPHVFPSLLWPHCFAGCQTPPVPCDITASLPTACIPGSYSFLEPRQSSSSAHRNLWQAGERVHRPTLEGAQVKNHENAQHQKHQTPS